MVPRWVELSPSERDAFRIAIRFLEGRLEERQTIEWALRLKPHQVAERYAVAELLDSHGSRKIKPLWREAWRLIEESWQFRIDKDSNSVRVHSVKESLGHKDFSGAVLSQIVNLVRPAIAANSFSKLDLAFRKLPKRPKKASDILSITLRSGELVPPSQLGLDEVQDVSFLLELANELSSATTKCLDSARRLGWNIDRDTWRLGSLHRVYFVPDAERSADDHEPDEFHEGIAPSVKLLHAVAAKQAANVLLDRQTRQSLAWSIVIESLHSFLEERASAVPHPTVQQMIRSLTEEVRANAAEAVQRFVTDLSSKKTDDPLPAETLFEKAARPFLQVVWPQERTLVTAGVSRALADLPASCGNAFVEAVNVVERFLAPFDCWSMVNYGLYGEGHGKPKLSKIDDEQRAEALLRLIDSTVGFADGAVVPVDLALALEQIQKAAPSLEVDPRFRRLSALARRL